MTTLESHINIKSIDKSYWKIYKFSEIAKSISERVEPTETELETYVGLEHLDSESIHIKRFGKRDDVTGTKLRCYPGDIIFGRRRAYQRKAAIVEFDGFCSAHSLVLRANPNVIDSKLFPFFLHSDTFMHRAVDISVGSLSPTINWGTLKNEEFLLPPKYQQARLAELLWASDALVQERETFQRKVETFLKVKREELISSGTEGVVTLQEICRKKISYGIVQAGPNIVGGMPYIKSSDLTDEGISLSRLECTSIEIAKKYERSEVESGDIVFSLRGNLGTVNIVPKELPKANLTQGTARLSPNDTVINSYLVAAIESVKVQTEIAALSKGSTFKEISLEALRTIKIPLPKSLECQKSIVGQVQSIKKVMADVKLELGRSKLLQKSLINQIF